MNGEDKEEIYIDCHAACTLDFGLSFLSSSFAQHSSSVMFDTVIFFLILYIDGIIGPSR